MPLRLVLVDDEAEPRTMLAKELGMREGFIVVGEAVDGPTAITLAFEHQPDLIVLGLGLSSFAGRDLLTGLRAAAPDALVVVYGGTPPEHVAPTDGPEAYVDKTQSLTYVVDLLEDVGSRIPRSATTRIGPDPRDIALARRFVVDQCFEWGKSATADDAAIVVSELVANALVHVRSVCDLTVGLRSNVLRIDVVDHGGGMPDLQNPTHEDDHGRGLLLVSILSTAWGSEPRDDGKSVWAELRAEQSMTVSLVTAD